MTLLGEHHLSPSSAQERVVGVAENIPSRTLHETGSASNMSERDRRKKATKRTIVVNLTVTIDIRLTDHLVHFMLRQTFTYTKP